MKKYALPILCFSLVLLGASFLPPVKPASAFVPIEIPVTINKVQYTGRVLVKRLDIGGREMLQVHAQAAGVDAKKNFPAKTHDVGRPGYPELLSQIFSYVNQICGGTGEFARLSPGDVGVILVNYTTVGGGSFTVSCN